MQVAALTLGQDSGQKDLVGGKQRQRVMATIAKSRLPVTIYSGPGMVIIEKGYLKYIFILWIAVSKVEL